MHPRHRLDLRLADLAYGAAGVVLAHGDLRHARRVLDRAGVHDNGLVALSVRSAWDLLLTAYAWPAGSEVVVSAVTHPAMTTLVPEAGFVPVPVDLDLDTLLPTTEAVAAALTSRTRAVLVAQLFGGRSDLTALAALCHERGLVLVEDAAQAWCGPAALRSAADVTLVSFGLIKTASAVGGALVRVDDAEVRHRLVRLQDTWPVQGRRAYAGRLLRAGALLLLTRPVAYGLLRSSCLAVGLDPDRLLDRATRTSADPRERRQRPGAPVLALLARRLAATDPSVDRTHRRTEAGERLRAGLPTSCQPGADASRTHWLFPVRSTDPAALVRRLRARGIDASASTSNLVALTSDGAAADLMRQVVYVPAYPELPAPIRHEVRQALVGELSLERAASLAR